MSQSERTSDHSDLIPNGPSAESHADADEAHDEDESASLSKDELFHLLQNQRRRYVIRYLKDTDESVSMRDVAEQVAAWEHDTTVQALTSDQRQRVYIALYQSHLSTLDEAGVIEYNKPRGIVEPTPLLDEVVEYVTDESQSDDEDDTMDDQWNRRYLGVSIVGSLLLVGTALNVSMFDLLSNFLANVLILGMFSMLTFARMGLFGGRDD